MGRFSSLLDGTFKESLFFEERFNGRVGYEAWMEEELLEVFDQKLRTLVPSFSSLFLRKENGSTKPGRCFATRFREPLRKSCPVGCSIVESFLPVMDILVSCCENRYPKLQA